MVGDRWQAATDGRRRPVTGDYRRRARIAATTSAITATRKPNPAALVVVAVGVVDTTLAMDTAGNTTRVLDYAAK